MAKKSLLFCLSFVLMLFIVTPVSASSPEKSGLSDEQVRQKLIDIGTKYGVEVITPDSSTSRQNNSLGLELKKFDSFEELKAFISALIMADKHTNQDISTFTSPQNFNTSSTYHDGHVKWYAMLVGGLFSWKNIDYSYRVAFENNGRGYLTNIFNVNSYLTGLQTGLDWTQTSSASTMWSGNTAYISVDGYYLVGAEVFGIPIGYKHKTTWNRTVEMSLPWLA